MIDVKERGPCSTQGCKNRGFRARGARDAQHLKLRKSFYCPGCIAAACQRSFHPLTALTFGTRR